MQNMVIIKQKAVIDKKNVFNAAAKPASFSEAVLKVNKHLKVYEEEIYNRTGLY